MRHDSSPHGFRSRRLPVERAPRPSLSKDSFDKKLQGLQEKASEGDHQSQVRLEAIHRLVDPCLHFYESDVRRILNKGYSPQIERGLRLYRLMSRLTLFCEPDSEIVGAACRVKLINLEELTLDHLLDIKGAHNLVSRVSDKGMNAESFNGLDLLKQEEKTLYEKSKKYFGGRKRPTLKSLAANLLSEEGTEVFSDRSVSNYLTAVRDFRRQYKNDIGITWFFIASIDSYNRNAKTGRETAKMVMLNLADATKKTGFPNILEGIAQIFREPLIPNSFLEGIRIRNEAMNFFAASYRREVGSIWNELAKGFQRQGVIANPFLSQLDGIRAIGAGINALAASNRLGLENTMRGVLGGLPSQASFAKYFPEEKVE